MDYLHSEESRQLTQQLIDEHELSSGFIEIDDGRVHIVEQGEGPPLVMLHGTGTQSLLFLPMLKHLEGVRVVAIDRPGHGLTHPYDLPKQGYRAASVAWLEEVVAALDLESFSLLGHSAGGAWAVWYALANPGRIDDLVVTGAPVLPGTSCPVPFRVMGTPGIGRVLNLLPTGSNTIHQFLRLLGEDDSALDAQPNMVDLLVAADRDPLTSKASLSEVHSAISLVTVMSPQQWRPQTAVTPDEMWGLDTPTMLLWGRRDPLADPEVVSNLAAMLPDGHVELIDAGHIPWLAHPREYAARVTGWVSQRASRE